MSVTASLPREATMRRSDLLAFARRQAREGQPGKTGRTSQIVFGERQYLLRVLDSIERTDLAVEQRHQQQQSLEKLIHARTRELNRLNPDWDLRIATVLRPDVPAEELERLAHEAPVEDYFLLRLISEHPRASAPTLAYLAGHPYPAIRENVARHPNADARTLTRLSRNRSHPLWLLVASNPSVPAALRKRLTRQMRQMSRRHRAK